MCACITPPFKKRLRPTSEENLRKNSVEIQYRVLYIQTSKHKSRHCRRGKQRRVYNDLLNLPTFLCFKPTSDK